MRSEPALSVYVELMRDDPASVYVVALISLLCDFIRIAVFNAWW